MRTILINIFDSSMARNILRTDVLAVLKREKGIKIVLLVPESKKQAYSKEFASENITIEPRPNVSASKFEQIVSFVSRNSIPTHTVWQIQMTGLDGTGMKRQRRIFARVFWALGHIYLWRFLVAKTGYFFFDEKVFNDLLTKYRPDLIFCSTIYTTNDLRLLKCAKKRGVNSVGMIKSWDNLTSKDPLLIHPNWLIVHNEIIKREAVEMGHYPEEKIFVSGVPQFDSYMNKDFIRPKEVFFNEMGLDPNKKLITFMAVGSCLSYHEREMIELIGDIVNRNELKYPSQLLVRLHPAFTSDEDKLEKIPSLIVDRPGKFVSSIKASLRDGWEFDREDTRHLAETLKWGDVSINFGSTTLIEAAMLDTPVIILAFDVVDEPNYFYAARRLSKREHMIPAIESGGVKVVWSKEELIRGINEYLKNPSLDEEGRKRLAKEQCYRADGKSAERIGNFLLEKLKK